MNFLRLSLLDSPSLDVDQFPRTSFCNDEDLNKEPHYRRQHRHVSEIKQKDMLLEQSLDVDSRVAVSIILFR
jgi:hypothetical protein